MQIQTISLSKIKLSELRQNAHRIASGIFCLFSFSSLAVTERLFACLPTAVLPQLSTLTHCPEAFLRLVPAVGVTFSAMALGEAQRDKYLLKKAAEVFENAKLMLGIGSSTPIPVCSFRVLSIDAFLKQSKAQPVTRDKQHLEECVDASFPEDLDSPATSIASLVWNSSFPKMTTQKAVVICTFSEAFLSVIEHSARADEQLSKHLYWAVKEKMHAFLGRLIPHGTMTLGNYTEKLTERLKPIQKRLQTALQRLSEAGNPMTVSLFFESSKPSKLASLVNLETFSQELLQGEEFAVYQAFKARELDVSQLEKTLQSPPVRKAVLAGLVSTTEQLAELFRHTEMHQKISRKF